MDRIINDIPKAKTLKRYKTVNDLPLTTIVSMHSTSEINRLSNVYEAKVVKLKKLSSGDSFYLTKTSTPIASTPKRAQLSSMDSFTTVSTIDHNNNNNRIDFMSKIHSKENKYGLAKLYIIRDFNGSLIYGDLSVRQGELVYLLCKSEIYLFVENQTGKFGFIPVDVCVDLEEVIINAKYKANRFQVKVTSF